MQGEQISLARTPYERPQQEIEQKVLLESFEEQRRWAAGASAGAKMNFCNAALLIISDSQHDGPRAIRVTHLDPVLDDQGQEYSQLSEYARADIADWRKVEQLQTTPTFGGVIGIVHRLNLGCTSRKASRLERLSGHIDIGCYVEEVWEKGSLLESDGFVFSRPEVPNFSINISVKKTEFGPRVQLLATGDGAFILDQAVMNNGKEILFDSLGRSSRKPGLREEYGYHKLPKKASLKILVGRFLKIEKRPFVFENIVLP
jgi:hypothetical protein